MTEKKQRYAWADHPNEYVRLMQGEYARWAFGWERALAMRGKWREEAFPDEIATSLLPTRPLDVEIGTGNGLHFAHRAYHNPERLLLGIELKFKPLVQSIRRSLRLRCTNACIVREDADRINELFAPNEINDVFIFFPDPWPKQRKQKNRLLTAEFLNELHSAQRANSFVHFKTDSKPYFLWALEKIRASPYKLLWHTEDLHQSSYVAGNFETHFENLFRRKGQSICAASLQRTESL